MDWLRSTCTYIWTGSKVLWNKTLLEKIAFPSSTLKIETDYPETSVLICQTTRCHISHPIDGKFDTDCQRSPKFITLTRMCNRVEYLPLMANTLLSAKKNEKLLNFEAGDRQRSFDCSRIAKLSDRRNITPTLQHIWDPHGTQGYKLIIIS